MANGSILIKAHRSIDSYMFHDMTYAAAVYNVIMLGGLFIQALESARTIIATILQAISPMEDNTSYINAADEIISVEKELSKVCTAI